MNKSSGRLDQPLAYTKDGLGTVAGYVSAYPAVLRFLSFPKQRQRTRNLDFRVLWSSNQTYIFFLITNLHL